MKMNGLKKYFATGLVILVLLAGGGVRGGKVHLTGPWPGLSKTGLQDGDLDVTTDYRRILADVLSKRCGVSASGLKSIFPSAYASAPVDVAVPKG